MKKEYEMKALGYRHAKKGVGPKCVDDENYMSGYQAAIDEMERQVKQSQVIQGVV